MKFEFPLYSMVLRLCFSFHIISLIHLIRLSPQQIIIKFYHNHSTMLNTIKIVITFLGRQYNLKIQIIHSTQKLIIHSTQKIPDAKYQMSEADSGCYRQA